MKIILPLTVTIPRKTKEDKVFAPNLNTYRNAHHMTLAQAKIEYSRLVQTIVIDGTLDGTYTREKDQIDPPYLFTYTIFPANNRKFDLANVLPIIQKFTDDALIDLESISDDSYKVIPAINYRFGGVDKESPRVELEITEWRE